MIGLIRQCILLVVIVGSAFTANNGGSLPSEYTGPHSLGPYRLDRDTSMVSLLAALGTKPAGKDTYCFSDKLHGLYLYARPKHDGSERVAEIMLSSFPNCRHLSIIPTTIDPKVWSTEEGIGIGSTKEDVVRVYRKPVDVRKLDLKSDLGVIAGIQEAATSHISVGDSSYLYSCLLSKTQVCDDDNRSTRIGFREGRVVWIRLSNSE